MLGKAETIAIGNRIRTLREQRGWTQRKLADQCGHSASYQGHIERGIRMPSIETISKISSSLGVSIEQLIHGSDAQAKAAPGKARKAHFLNEDTGNPKKRIEDWLRDA